MIFHPVELVHGLERVARLELHRDEDGFGIFIAKRLGRDAGAPGPFRFDRPVTVPDPARAKIPDVAGAFVVRIADRCAERSDRGQFYAGGTAQLVVIPIGELLCQAVLAGRVLGDDADCTRRGVAAEQGALRPAQDFDAFQIGQFECGTLRTSDVDAIEIKRDRLVLPRHRSEADRTPHGEVGDADRACGLAHEKVRRLRGKVERVGDTICPQAILGDRGDRDRHVLQALLSLLRGDDDIRNAHAAFGILRKGGRRINHGDERGTAQQSPTDGGARSQI